MKTIFILATVAFFVLSSNAHAKDVTTGPIAVIVTKVVDGDTFNADASIWPSLWAKAKVRVDGLDTPEIHGKCQSEKLAAIKAKNYLADILSSGNVTLTNVRFGKWAGRVVATVLVNGNDIAKVMIAAGYGRPYHGGKRGGWCD